MTEWQRRARCADLMARGAVPADLWHPLGYSEQYAAQVRWAKTECGHCPVRQQCGTWAMVERVDEGILGGMTPPERIAQLAVLARERRNVRRATPSRVRGEAAQTVDSAPARAVLAAAEAAGMSMPDLARAAGIRPDVVRALEAGQKLVTRQTLTRLQDVKIPEAVGS